MDNPYASRSKLNPSNANGHRKIPNGVYWALLKAQISGAELRVALTVFDRTQGYSLDSRPITMTAFEGFTGLRRDSVANAIKQLEENHIIVVRHGKGTTPNEYLFNLYYDTWTVGGQLTLPNIAALPEKERTITFWPQLRAQIMERDNYTCLYCGVRSQEWAKMFVDHIVPRNMGGESIPSNLVACCYSCNSRKRDKTLDEFLPFLDQERVTQIILPRIAQLASGQESLTTNSGQDLQTASSSQEKQTASSPTLAMPRTEANRASSTETITSPRAGSPTRSLKQTILKQTIKASTRECFARFWEAYPKRLAKGAAEKAFAKLAPTEEILERMIASIDAWKASDQWIEQGGKYIPYPATWLNQKRWEDEPPREGTRARGQKSGFSRPLRVEADSTAEEIRRSWNGEDQSETGNEQPA